MKIDFFNKDFIRTIEQFKSGKIPQESLIYSLSCDITRLPRSSISVDLTIVDSEKHNCVITTGHLISDFENQRIAPRLDYIVYEKQC